MDLGYHENQGSVETQLFLPVCHPRHLQSLRRRLDASAERVGRTGEGARHADLREVRSRYVEADGARGPGFVDDVEDGRVALRGPRHRPVALEAAGLERQPVLGITVQDAEVPARLS